jgi:hypothetical protein
LDHYSFRFFVSIRSKILESQRCWNPFFEKHQPFLWFIEALWFHTFIFAFVLPAVMRQVILWMGWMVLMVRIHIIFIVVHEAITGCGILAYSTMGTGKYGTKNALSPIYFILSYFSACILQIILSLCRF